MVEILKRRGFGGLFADEMGLGKTVQVLAFFSQLKLQKPFLIVVPTSLIFNWQREIEKFLPSAASIATKAKTDCAGSTAAKANDFNLVYPTSHRF